MMSADAITIVNFWMQIQTYCYRNRTEMSELSIFKADLDSHQTTQQ